ncbi:MAG: PEGA domain-containing protein, partial [Spirochaetaceae bacterium]
MRSFGPMFRLFRVAAGAVVFAAIMVMLGCATASGSLFESEVSAPTERRVGVTEPDDTTAEDEDDEEEEEKVGLAIRTSPTGADVFVDGRRTGTSPLRRELPTGQYHIVAEKDGYRSAELFVSHVHDQYQEVRLELEEILGRLYIDVVPPDAEVRTGFRSVTPGRETELRIGVYPLAISAFGYETHRESIVVNENLTTTISVVLEEAPFRVDSFSARVDHFSPTDPGLLGSASFTVVVSGPGSGEYRVEDSSGRVVLDPIPISFTERSTTVRWDGHDTGGSRLPDGEFTIVFTGDNDIHETHSVSIDRTITRRARPVFGGAAGTLYSPLPASFP